MAIGRKLLIYFIIFVISAIVTALIYSFLKPIFFPEKPAQPINKERTMEDVLKDFTAPAAKEAEIPKEVLDDFTAPPSDNQIPEDVLKNFTAPKQ